MCRYKGADPHVNKIRFSTSVNLDSNSHPEVEIADSLGYMAMGYEHYM